MAARLVSVVGRKNAGKTTLTVALCRAFLRAGHRPMTIKHGHHPALVDGEGTDTWRHFNEGGAARTLIASPTLRVLFERAADDYDPVGLARRYMADADIVIVEGFSRSTLPRLEIWRSILEEPPLYTGHAVPSLWLGVVSDAVLEAPCPVLALDAPDHADRAAELAWAGAMLLDP